MTHAPYSQIAASVSFVVEEDRGAAGDREHCRSFPAESSGRARSIITAIMNYTRISADCHIDMPWIPADLFTANASAAMRERMPYVVDGPDGPH